MKIPQMPTYTDEDEKMAWEMARDMDVIDAVFACNKKYLHWEEIKYRKLPADPKHIWFLMKVFRARNTRSVGFGPWKFRFALDDECWKKLHLLDTSAGGSLASMIDAVGQDKERYIVNSLMEEAIASSQIEGAATTRVAAKQMLQERKKPRNRDELMILNNYLTMKEVAGLRGEPLSPELVRRLHAMITRGTLEDPAYEGAFRENDDIRVVDSSGAVLHVPPPHEEIEGLVDELCAFANGEEEEFIHPVVKGIVLHFLMGYIHPFNDGNGRCARTLFYWYVLKQDYWLFEYMAISRAIRESRGQYKRAYLYTETDENDLTYFIRYNLDVIEKTIEEVRAYIKEQQEKQIEALHLIEHAGDLNLRQVEILKMLMRRPERPMTIKEVMEVFGVAYGTARSDLLRLAGAGYVEKRTMGKEFVFLYGGSGGAPPSRP
ncbi:MAG: Fic family protein [Methanofollis liminatans]|uniref:Filamentation induced by cAMP protein Fic n=1 Tax=Methanofollis liminatans DSM 4140 TaxID=28892 RepID=J1AMX8_9EURY|nr:Fic family protein [Methanofollis liminatans]EJG06198.1 filamentation induced by cAMP protein Fic [Methanofollis liminatans DSM 4140]MDD3111376.1 Fic family protein [Methanofollis liminatans]